MSCQRSIKGMHFGGVIKVDLISTLCTLMYHPQLAVHGTG